MNIQDATVLVVDDDPLMRKYICSTLNRLPVKAIYEAADGKQGLLAANTFTPDVILSDVHMASMGGLEFVQQLRRGADRDIGRIPVIMLSADDKKETFQDAVPLGIFGHLSKPPQLSQLKKMMERALKFRHPHQGKEIDK
jgi:two-component system, chemotaxis family, chemotaxis protein CheY